MSAATLLPSYVGTTESSYTKETLEKMDTNALIEAATKLSEKNSQSIKDLTTKLEQSAKTKSEIITKTFNPKTFNPKTYDSDEPVIKIFKPPSNQLAPAPSTTSTTPTTATTPSTTPTTPSIRSLLQQPPTIPVLSSEGLKVLQQTLPLKIADKPSPPPSPQASAQSLQQQPSPSPQASAPSADLLGIQQKQSSIPRNPNPLSPAKEAPPALPPPPAKAATPSPLAPSAKEEAKAAPPALPPAKPAAPSPLAPSAKAKAKEPASPPPPAQPAQPAPSEEATASQKKEDLPQAEPEPEHYRTPFQQLQIHVGETLGINAGDEKTLEAVLEAANYDVYKAYNFIKEDASAQKQQQKQQQQQLQKQQQQKQQVPRTTEMPLERIASTDGKETYTDKQNKIFEKIQVYGDGSCFFRAVAVGLSKYLQGKERNKFGIATSKVSQNEEDEAMYNVKGTIIEYIRINWEEMQGFYADETSESIETFETISKKISKRSYYAGEPEIVAFANAYTVHLIIYDMSNEENTPIIEYNPGGKKKIHLIRTGENRKAHYDFLKPVQLGGCRTKQKKTSKRTHKKGKSKFHKKRSTIRKRKTHRKRK